MPHTPFPFTPSDPLDAFSDGVLADAAARMEALLDEIEVNISCGDYSGNSFIPGARELMNDLLEKTPRELWVKNPRVYWYMLQIELEADGDEALLARFEELQANPTYKKACLYAKQTKSPLTARIEALERAHAEKGAQQKAAADARHEAEQNRLRMEDEARRAEETRRRNAALEAEREAQRKADEARLAQLAAETRRKEQLERQRRSVDARIFEMDGTTLIRYKGHADTVTIPAYIEIIGDGAFEDCDEIWEVTIPDGVREIGARAFAGCTALGSITLPDSITHVGEEAFEDCPLTSATVPAHAAASVAVYELESVEITSGTAIADDAFRDCDSLSDVTLPESLRSIGSGAFTGCTALEDITIPAGVTEVAEDAFEDCPLATATIPACAARAVAGDMLVDVQITGGTAIAANAFEDCDSLSDITLPAGLLTIGAEAFSGCGALLDITVPDSVTTVGQDAFAYCPLTGAVIPACAVRAVAAETLETVEITSGTEIEERAFEGCDMLTDVTLPEGLLYIGAAAFSGCSSLEVITIPDSVVSVAEDAFEGCPLVSATIPACAARAVACEELETVEITSGSELEENAFENCAALYEVTVAESVSYIGAYAFAGCDSLEAIVLPLGCDFDVTAFPDECEVEIG